MDDLLTLQVYEEFVNARNEMALDIGYVDPTVASSMVSQTQLSR